LGSTLLDELTSCRYKRRVKRWETCLAVTLAVIIAAGGLWLFLHRHTHRYDRLIKGAAGIHGVDPALVKAVVWRESRFNPHARGRAGEIGLMQIGEAAAWEWAASQNIPEFSHEHVSDPRTNLLAGTWYLARLLKRYPNATDPIPFALADYNAGRGHVLRWNHGAGASNASVFIEQITFPGTRRYIETVLAQRDRYQ
jgi:soluble lytic murein transglycosylase